MAATILQAVRLVLIPLALIVANSAMCKEYLYESTEPFFRGSDINIVDSVDAEDPKYSFMKGTGTWGFSNRGAVGEIYVRVWHDCPDYAVAWSYEVTLDVIYYLHSSGTNFTKHTEQITLYLNHNPDATGPFSDYQVFTVAGAYRIVAKVVDVDESSVSVLSTLAPNLELGARGRVERFYNPEPTYVIQNAVSSHIIARQEVKFEWDTKEGVEWYDLEWGWIDNSNGNGGTLTASAIDYCRDLDRNATRVRITGTSHNISLIYGEGYILYRVRPVWLTGDNYDQPFGGRWTDYSQPACTTVAGYANSFLVGANEAHEDLLNWQYTASYAEEGRRKEVVRYFDGSLRERQTVTKLYEDDEAIVAEKIYDHQGRPAVEILPAPAASAVLKYYRKFNVNPSEKPYSRLDFDLDPSLNPCEREVDSLSYTSGAGAYYTARTTTGFDAYVPDAGGYPFVVTEYTSDQTGRVRRQSGVGDAHYMGSDRETRYYYGSPMAGELDRLFGTEIGFAQHYKKIMTMDPNGQVSVTYQDLSGKTIATALAGSSPSNLSALESNTDAATVTDSLLVRNERSYTPPVVELRYPILVSSQGDYSFVYENTPQVFTEMCLAYPTFCFECVYEVNIRVVDECGVELLNSGSGIYKTIGSANGVCSSPIDPVLIGGDSMTIDDLPVGQYTVHKTLRVSQSAAQSYADMYMEEQTCLKEFKDFFYDKVTALDLENKCHVEQGCPPSDPDCSFRSSYCGKFLFAMLQDVSPGGQYMEFDVEIDEEGVSHYTADSLLSMLNRWHMLPCQDNGCIGTLGGCQEPFIPWKNPTTPYLDEDGTASVVDFGNGLVLAPEDLPHWVLFVQSWRPSWALSLVQYHPEYCYYEWCDANSASFSYDSLMLETHTFAQAFDRGLLDPLMMGHPYVHAASGDQNYANNPDPYFYNSDVGVKINPQYDSMEVKLMEYFDDGTNNPASLWEIAIGIVFCPDPPCTHGSIIEFISLELYRDSLCHQDKIWQVFRNLYLAIKWEVQEPLRAEYAIANKCYNGCIGNIAFNPSLYNFSGSTTYGMKDQPCGSVTESLYLTKAKRFPNLADVLGRDPYDPVLSNRDTIDSIATATLQLICDSTCAGYVQYWMEALAGCISALPIDTTIHPWGPGNSMYDELVDRLLAVCLTGCDSVNPFGASTTPPFTFSSYGDASFEEVLSGVFSNYNISYSAGIIPCNPYLISMPSPYGHTYLGSETFYPVLDTCACTWLFEQRDLLEDWIIANPEDSLLSMEEFLVETTGLQLHLVQEMLCACDLYWVEVEVWEWAEGAQEELKARMLMVPFEITCPPCITCGDFMSVYEEIYLAEFNWAMYDDSTRAEYDARLLHNFMNANFGFTLPYWSYKEFQRRCEAIIEHGIYIEETITSQAQDLEELIDFLIWNGWILRGPGELNEVELGQFPQFIDLAVEIFGCSEPECWELRMEWRYSAEAHKLPTGIGYIGTFVFYNACTEEEVCPFELQVQEEMMNLFESDIETIREHFTAYQNNFQLMEGHVFETNSFYTFDCPNYHFIRGYSPDGVWQPEWTLYGSTTCFYIQDCALESTELCNTPLFPSIPEDTLACCKTLIRQAAAVAWREHQAYLDSARTAFVNSYNRFCVDSATEVFTMSYPAHEYHYTLYYYDRAGNLVRTVPPVAVVPITNSNDLEQIHAYRKALLEGTTPPAKITPSHNFNLASEYRFNSFNQVFEQETPDGGQSHFWYDAHGRLVLSQNAKQAIKENCDLPQGGGLDPNQCYRFSYTKYDHMGRIIEVGEMRTGGLYEPDPDDFVHIDWPYNNSIARQTYEVNKTYYDVPNTGIPAAIEQRHLRGRVATVTWQQDEGTAYDYASHYTYDAHGNVDTLWQEYVPLEPIGQDLKQMVYRYDLVSGNVNLVHYNPGHTDQMLHRYVYDADNRIRTVYTSRDAVIWDRDADYHYYRHGPLARTELGDLKVQGIDYAYTIHGWIKGVNSNLLGPDNDMGSDGGTGSDFARDAFGYSLSYYDGDYTPVGQGNTFLASLTSSALDDATPSLYNGNIRHMVTSLTNLTNTPLDVQATAYKYDQLNRLTHMQAHVGITTNEWPSTGSAIDQYGIDTIRFDANGNIDYLYRNGNLSGSDLQMDHLEYHYYTNTNQLAYVTDTVSPGTYSNDIDNQSANNYTYDAIGNLISDAAEEIFQIQWYVNGKIKAIIRDQQSAKSNLYFAYGPDGQRIYKKVVEDAGTGAATETWYVRDAQGNPMAIYEERSSDLYVQEHNLYGSSRLGVIKSDILVEPLDPVNEGDTVRYTRTLGHKYFELSNHLGNVLSTVSDQKISVDDNGSVDYYLPKVVSYSDYYPFGMQMEGRSGGTDYRFSFNGMEQDNEVKGAGNSYDFGARIYDARLGRWLSVDPLSMDYPFVSPYVYCINRPISVIDPDGQRIIIVGSPEYRKEIKGVMFRAAIKSRTARQIILKTILTKHTLVITQNPSQERGNDNLLVSKSRNEDGTMKALMYFSSETTTINEGKDRSEITMTPEITMIHEFAHFVDFIEVNESPGGARVWDPDTYDPYKGNYIPAGELFAVEIENRVRAEMGEALRYYYGDVLVYNMKFEANSKSGNRVERHANPDATYEQFAKNNTELNKEGKINFISKIKISNTTSRHWGFGSSKVNPSKAGQRNHSSEIMEKAGQ